MSNIRSRVAIINDFKSTRAFVDYKSTEDIEWVVACEVGHIPDKNKATHSIAIFLDFKKVADVKNKEEARAILERLISSLPKEAQRYMLEYKDYLTKTIV